MSDNLCGITRVPYYPELELFAPSDEQNSITALTLSYLLYWYSQKSTFPFNARQHLVQLSRTLRRDQNEIEKALYHLTELHILDKKEHRFETNSDDPNKRYKTDVFYTLNFHTLGDLLKENGLNVPQKVLRLAADDSFDLLSYLSPRRLPVIQGLLGMIKGDEYDEATFDCAQILCGICKETDLEPFSYKALAPGWHMLVQPPAESDDIAPRWQRAGERSIDVDLTDGSFFVPDGNYFGTEEHHLWHTTKKMEPRILGAALYLAVAANSKDIHFVSELSVMELTPAFKLLKRLTGKIGRLDDAYFDNLEIYGEELAAERQRYQELIDSMQ